MDALVSPAIHRSFGYQRTIPTFPVKSMDSRFSSDSEFLAQTEGGISSSESVGFFEVNHRMYKGGNQSSFDSPCESEGMDFLGLPLPLRSLLAPSEAKWLEALFSSTPLRRATAA